MFYFVNWIFNVSLSVGPEKGPEKAHHHREDSDSEGELHIDMESGLFLCKIKGLFDERFYFIAMLVISRKYIWRLKLNQCNTTPSTISKTKVNTNHSLMSWKFF